MVFYSNIFKYHLMNKPDIMKDFCKHQHKNFGKNLAIKIFYIICSIASETRKK